MSEDARERRMYVYEWYLCAGYHYVLKFNSTYFSGVIWNQYWLEWWALADSPPCLFIILLFHLHIIYLFKLISIIRIHAPQVPCNTTPVTCKYRTHVITGTVCAGTGTV